MPKDWVFNCDSSIFIITHQIPKIPLVYIGPPNWHPIISQPKCLFVQLYNNLHHTKCKTTTVINWANQWTNGLSSIWTLTLSTGFYFFRPSNFPKLDLEFIGPSIPVLSSWAWVSFRLQVHQPTYRTTGLGP